MKHSFRTKITLLLTIMVVFTLLITWFINSTFLPEFYTRSKRDNLIDVYNKIADIYKDKTEDYLSEENTSHMEQLETKYDVKIYVLNSQLNLIYPTPENVGRRELGTTVENIARVLAGLHDPSIEDVKTLKRTDVYSVQVYYNKQMNSSYMDMSGILTFSKQNTTTSQDTDKSDNTTDSQQSGDNTSKDSSGNANNSDNTSKTVTGFVYLRSNYESITTGVSIANEFLAYVGIFAAMIGTIVMFILSKKFTKPIQDLSGIAKQMSDLNFDVKYKVTSKDEIGELGNSINTLSDKLETTIVELKQANNELMTDIQRKTEIDEMRKEFLSNVSHELKTPIALIQGYSEGLKENVNDDEESRDYYCEVIMDEANKMNNMVKKLLSLNELEFGNNQVNFDRFDIVALIKSVLSSTEILFKQKEVTLHFEQEEPVYVWADEFLIEQVVTNYISNALNHVSANKIIEIKLILKEDTVRVAVFNTGDNIPEDEIDKIWIKFYKIDKARTREYGGSGIGLSIVKAIMNSHNKECGVINRPIGVEFWFELDTKS